MFSLSNYVDTVNTTFIFIVAIAFAFLVLITFLMIFFVIKYNRKRNKKAVNIHGNLPLEITWTIIPIILVLFMFYFGWVGYEELSNPPKDAMNIKVTGQMWKWNFEYDNGLKTDTLYVPQNKPIKLTLNSIDVNHSFFVPALRFKKDAFPNRENVVWFNPKDIGKYDVACAEYCGLNHSQMYTKIVVIPMNEFSQWLNEQTKKMNSASIDSINVNNQVGINN
ncbi:MAG: hypothetical protein STSR0008_10590 [Ignavibacterium sp.]